MRKLTILVDMDDTIERLTEAWISWLNQKHDTKVRYEDISEWDLRKFFPQLTEEQVYEPLMSDDFWNTVRPMQEASNVLSWAKEQGHRIYIVTSSNYKTIKNKVEQMLFQNFPFLSWDDVIVTSNKQLIRGDILFDDAPHNLEGGKFIKVLVDAPHNQNYDAEKNGMYRMKYWHEAENFIYVIAHSDEFELFLKEANTKEVASSVLGVNPLLYQQVMIDILRKGRENI